MVDDLVRRFIRATDENGGIAPSSFTVSQEEWAELSSELDAMERRGELVRGDRATGITQIAGVRIIVGAP
jgi:hypothetical protein